MFANDGCPRAGLFLSISAAKCIKSLLHSAYFLQPGILHCYRENAPWDGKSPISIAAAIIYMVTQLPAAKSKPSTATIAMECGVAEGTLHSTYRDLYSERASLIPQWFAKADQLHCLHQPREKN